MIKDQQIESEVYLMEPGRFQTLSGRYLKHEYGGNSIRLEVLKEAENQGRENQTSG